MSLRGSQWRRADGERIANKGSGAPCCSGFRIGCRRRRNAQKALGSGVVARSEDADQAALIKAIAEAKITLLQGIAQVAKEAEVPTEAKYEMEGGKLMLSIYTSAKGFNTPAEDNSFNEYGGEATTTTWNPKKEVFTDREHIARSAQYHTLLSMTCYRLCTAVEG